MGEGVRQEFHRFELAHDFELISDCTTIPIEQLTSEMMKDSVKYRKEAHRPACIYDLLKNLQSFLIIKIRHLWLA